MKFGCFSASPDIDVNDTNSLLVILSINNNQIYYYFFIKTDQFFILIQNIEKFYFICFWIICSYLKLFNYAKKKSGSRKRNEIM